MTTTLMVAFLASWAAQVYLYPPEAVIPSALKTATWTLLMLFTIASVAGHLLSRDDVSYTDDASPAPDHRS